MASSKLIFFTIIWFASFGLTYCISDAGDAAVLRKFRQIWKNTPPNWENSDDPCSVSWDGINCKASRIVGLTLASLGLDGTLSGDIGQLSELQFLDLSFNNNLTGPIPSAIGNLQKLETLSLSGCDLGGSIPPEIANLRELTFLALNSNNLTGRIPPNIGRLSKLNWLDLGNNQLSGPLPISSGRTHGLDQLLRTQHFHFSQNQLSGTIPEALFHSKMTLIHILLDGNNFTGPIPASVGLLEHLEILRLDRNALTGTVPSSIRNLTRLRKLNLAKNGLRGDVPDLTGMAALNYVDLSKNLFTSAVAPSWFTSLRSLAVLLMEYDGLIGEVPTALFSSPQLQELILSNNKFNGTVDLGMASGSGLELVDLRDNIITGVQNEPKDNSTTLMLIGNPVCNSQLARKSFCMSADSQTYSSVSRCTNQCPKGQGNWPLTCGCANPYTGTLIFRGPFFRDLRNATRFRCLEKDLQDKLELGDGSVSLKNAFFDADEYLRVHLELFPSDGDFFNRSRVQKLGAALSTQGFKAYDDEWGPYEFKAEPYIFSYYQGTKFSAALVASIASSSVVLFIGLVALGIYAVREKRAADRARRVADPFSNWATDEEEAGSAPQLNGVGFFSFNDVKKCTADFSKENEIGVGGYGQVYKGKLPSGELVAIKRAKQGSMQGALEFKTEIELLSRVHHTNLVRLVGFCYEKGEQMLIYEYIPNGTLAESLSGKNGIKLSWMDRLGIALGSARGLAYLHELADPPIIHRDVKTANILLDERLRPKVADFGLSSLAVDPGEMNDSMTVKGTVGYLDPEYCETQQSTDKSDVYSFGVVMLELLTGKKPIDRNRYIVTEVREELRSPDGVKEIVDPVIRYAPILSGLERFVGLALRCVEQFSDDRPTMREVVKEIESILESDVLDSRFVSMTSAVRENVVAVRSGDSEWTFSREMSSNNFDGGAAGYLLQTEVIPGSGTWLRSVQPSLS